MSDSSSSDSVILDLLVDDAFASTFEVLGFRDLLRVARVCQRFRQIALNYCPLPLDEAKEQYKYGSWLVLIGGIIQEDGSNKYELEFSLRDKRNYSKIKAQSTQCDQAICDPSRVFYPWKISTKQIYIAMDGILNGIDLSSFRGLTELELSIGGEINLSKICAPKLKKIKLLISGSVSTRIITDNFQSGNIDHLDLQGYNMDKYEDISMDRYISDWTVFGGLQILELAFIDCGLDLYPLKNVKHLIINDCEIKRLYSDKGKQNLRISYEGDGFNSVWTESPIWYAKWMFYYYEDDLFIDDWKVSVIYPHLEHDRPDFPGVDNSDDTQLKEFKSIINI